MSNPTTFVPPEWAADQERVLNPDTPRDLAYFIEAAKSGGACDSCGEPAWRYGGCGLCFTCTTGESDPSADYELKIGAPWPKEKKAAKP